MSVQMEKEIFGADVQTKNPKAVAFVGRWMREIKDAIKREESWRKNADMCVDLYEGVKKKEYQYNILYANTETISPALYNEVPRPTVKRRFKDDDPVGLAAAKATQRALEFFVDTNEFNYAPFDDLIKACVLDSLVPGRGICRFKYDAEIVEPAKSPEAPSEDAQSEEDQTEIKTTADNSDVSDASMMPGLPAPQIKYETICGEEIPWNRFIHGFAKVWNRVPWAGIIHFMDEDELEKNFGEEIAARVPKTYKDIPTAKAEETNKQNTNEKEAEPSLACVYEIWDKDSKKVIFLAEGYADGPLKIVDDPLQLTGFFPWPKPLMLFQKSSTLTPTTLYTQYEEQAKELNMITLRINKLIDAMRLRGFYDPRVSSIRDMMRSTENELTPANGLENMGGDMRNFDAIIWIMPIDKMIGVIQQLYVQREQIKTVIYEIMGIADILRGSSKASETLGAQNIKAQWGSLRLKRMQKEVMRYCRDCLRIMAEIGMKKLQPTTLAKMTGLPFVMGEEKTQAQQMVQLAQAQGQQPDPKAIETASAISWDDVLSLLRDDISRAYRIDVETNSTLDPEASEDQKNISDLMGALSQFLNGLAPLISEGVLPFEMAQSMLLAVVRRYRFGDEIEEYIKSMKAPQPKGKDDGKAQAAQMQMQLDQQRLEFEKQSRQVEQQANAQESQFKLQLMQQEAAQKLQLERERMDAELALKQQQMQNDFALAQQKLAQEKELEMYKARITAQANERATVKSAQLSAAASVAAANGRPSGE